MTYNEAYEKALKICVDHGIDTHDRQRIVSYFKWGVGDDSFTELAEDYYGSSKMGEAHAILAEGAEQQEYRESSASDKFIAAVFEDVYLELTHDMVKVIGELGDGAFAAEASDGSFTVSEQGRVLLVIEDAAAKDLLKEIETARPEDQEVLDSLQKLSGLLTEYRNKEIDIKR